MGKIASPAVNDPFLIDECLSPDLVALAHARGHHATHVVFRGLQGTQDADLVPIIRESGFVLVTNNGKDLLPLYAAEEIHPGLVIIIPGSLEREKQIAFESFHHVSLKHGNTLAVEPQNQEAASSFLSAAHIPLRGS